MDAPIFSPEQLDDHLLNDQEEGHFSGTGRLGQVGAVDFLAQDFARPSPVRTHISKQSGLPKAGPGTVPVELKGKPLIGLVNKLSGWGFSLHQRFLKLNKKGLAYFREAPPGGQQLFSTAQEVELINDQYKPKEVVPVGAIVEVAPLTEAERKEKKKFFKDPTVPAFKVVFRKNESAKKKDLIPQSDEQSLAQININDLEEEKKREGSTKAKEKGLKTWFFSLAESAKTGP